MKTIKSTCVLLLATLSSMTALCFLAQPAQAKPLIQIEQVISPKHKIKAWLVQDKTNPIISLSFAFKNAGTAQDPNDKQGLVRLLSNTMDEGAGALDSQIFQKTLNDNSITLRFGADRDNFSGTVKTLSRTQDIAFALLKSALNAPRFDAEPVQRMIEANLSRIKSSLPNPNWIAARLTHDAVFKDHPYAKNSGGTLSSLQVITQKDLKNYHAKALAKDNLIIAVAGDITPKQLSIMMDDVFAALPDTNSLPEIPHADLAQDSQTYLFEKDIPQTVINITQAGISVHDPDYHYAQIANFIFGSSGFGSRLTKTIREDKGLTYGIYSQFNNHDHAQLLNITTSTANKNVQTLLNLVQSEYKAMLHAPITNKELDDAKTYLIGQLPLMLTSTDNISALLLNLQTQDLPVNYLDLREQTIKQATIANIENAVQKLLKPDMLTTIMVGSPTLDIPANIIETLPNVE